MKGLLIYATRYGSTEQVCRWIGEGLPFPISVEPVSNRPIAAADFLVLGTPIFIGKPAKEMIEFIDKCKTALCRVPVFIFITSWAQSTVYQDACQGFLELLLHYLSPCIPVMTRSLPGKLLWDSLTVSDRKAMERLLRRIDARQPDFHSEKIQWQDQRDRRQCLQFGEEIAAWLMDSPQGGRNVWIET